MKLKTLTLIMLGSFCAQVMADPAQPTTGITVPAPTLQTGSTGTGVITSDKDKISYSAGVQIGQGLRMRGMAINVELLVQGIKDGYNGQHLQMNEQEIRDTLVNYQRELTAKMTQKFNAEKGVNVQASTTYLENNKKQPGVVTTPSGLQYKVLTQGTGPKPVDTDVIVVNYSGTTIDGKEFDSSYKRGQPMTAQLKYMIPGWVEALKLMNKGSTWMLYIPANLAYGDRGAPPVIGPNQALIFKVELLDIKKAST